MGEAQPDVVLADIRMPPTKTDEGIQLAAELRVTHPGIGVVILSQYAEPLKVLKDAGLVRDRPAGARRIYQLNPDGVGALRAYLDRFWTQSLAAFKQAAEKPTKEVSR